MDKKPTYNQIQTLFRWAEWSMPRDKAVEYSKVAETFTRGEISNEISRLYQIKSRGFGRVRKEDLMRGIIGLRMEGKEIGRQ